MTKLLILYYSQTGHNFQMANWAYDEVKDMAEVRIRKVEELLDTAGAKDNPGWKKYLEDSKDIELASSDDLVWADAILVSSPTRFGNVASQMKFFLDQQGGLWAQGKLRDKLFSAMSSAQNNNGGQEQTIRALYTTAMHWGAIIVAPGYNDDSIFAAGGNPYGTSGTATNEGFANDLEGAVRFQARRLVEVDDKFNK